MRYELDKAHNAILIQSASEVGAAVAKVFTGLLQHEFGDTSFTVRQARPQQAGVEAAVA